MFSHTDPIDHFFARTVLHSIEDTAVYRCLCYLFYLSRKGHLCLEVTNDAIYPNEVKDPDLVQSIRQGFHSLSKDLYSENRKGNKPLVKKNQSIYLQKNWIYESIILEKTKELLHNKPDSVIDRSLAFERVQKSRLLPKQKQAIEYVFEHSLTFICGGPGTGKSYTASKLIEYFSQTAQEPLEITVTAATGKAVSHLEEKMQKGLQFQAKTLHSLLGLSQKKSPPFDEVFISSDLIIVDEASMIDVKVFAYLLVSIKPKARLVLIGDPNQLPPVEAGSVFVDLSQKQAIHLDENIRTQNSDLKKFAKHILDGDVFLSMHMLHQQTIPYQELSSHIPISFFDRFIKARNEPINVEEVYQTFQTFRILSCVRQGPFGVDALNQQLFDYYFKQTKKEHYLAVPIIMTQNDPQLELYNGMNGVLLLHQDIKKVYFCIKGKFKEFTSYEIPKYEYAFVLSVHKSQGSEFCEVIILVPNGSESFGREILYTAVTRAKKRLQIIGITSVIEEVIQKQGKKYSGILRALNKL